VAASFHFQELLLVDRSPTVGFCVKLSSLFMVNAGLDMVAMCDVGVVSCLFMIASFMVLSCFAMMFGSMLTMFRGFLMVFNSFRHFLFSTIRVPTAGWIGLRRLVCSQLCQG
jgi:hypothetical protein